MPGSPAIVLPLHDWHWNQNAKDGYYKRLPEVLDDFGVKFIPIETGISVEID